MAVTAQPHLRLCREARDVRDRWWLVHDRAFCEAVIAAREAGLTLREIGAAVGLSAPGVKETLKRGARLRQAGLQRVQEGSAHDGSD